MTDVHAHAIIEEGAILGQNVKVGAFSIIKKGANIGDNTIIGERCTIDGGVVVGTNNKIISDVIIRGKVHIGNNNHILPGTKIGFWPKWTSYKEFEGEAEIGHDNFIGENFIMTLNAKDGGCTKLGNRCYIFNNVTIHHDCQIGLDDDSFNYPDREYNTILCCGVNCNGSVVIGKGADIGSGSHIHHNRHIGIAAKVAMNTAVVHDVLPFATYISQKTIVGHNNKDKPQYFISAEALKVKLHTLMLQNCSAEEKLQALNGLKNMDMDDASKAVINIMYNFLNNIKEKAKLNCI